jgi:hypothetical protein
MEDFIKKDLGEKNNLITLSGGSASAKPQLGVPCMANAFCVVLFLRAARVLVTATAMGFWSKIPAPWMVRRDE